MSATSEVLTHVAGLHLKAIDAGVSADKALEVLRQGLARLPDGERWLDLVQHLQNALSAGRTHTDESLRVLRAAVTAGLDTGPVLASAHALPASPSSLTPPPYILELLVRGAMLLQVHGLGAVVSFNLWSDGKDNAYTARLVWRFEMDDEAPRLVVSDARSGEFICQSVVGSLFEIDAQSWDIPVASDEIERGIWEQAQRKAAGAPC